MTFRVLSYCFRTVEFLSNTLCYVNTGQKKPQLGFIGLNIVESSRNKLRIRKYCTIKEVRAFKDNLLSWKWLLKS